MLVLPIGLIVVFGDVKRSCGDCCYVEVHFSVREKGLNSRSDCTVTCLPLECCATIRVHTYGFV